MKSFYYQKEEQTIYLGDCLTILKEMPENSVDCVITDPPAGIGFMGKEWDTFDKENFVTWLQKIAEECLRVLKPGGHALVWALPRTSHWTATAWENAGFEVRDRIVHCFGSGFPKSHNIGVAVDKLQGNKREDLGAGNDKGRTQTFGGSLPKLTRITRGTSEWEGWGTALKPAIEDWWLLRKPLSEKTVAQNVLKWGVGGLNIDACRIGSQTEIHSCGKRTIYGGNSLQESKTRNEKTEIRNFGRFPSHLIIDDSEEVKNLFPNNKGAFAPVKSGQKGFGGEIYGKYKQAGDDGATFYGDGLGSASRFFYVAKASRSERNKGCREFYWLNDEPIKKELWDKLNKENELNKDNKDFKRHSIAKGNIHPTLKSAALMEYLIKLICPKNGIILDPFLGSGTTNIAAARLGRKCVGIEISEKYCEIAKQRLEAELNQKKLL